MVRLALVLLGVAAVLLSVAARLYALGQGLGIAAGALFFLSGTGRGGMLGNARRFERGPADVSARLGVLLAAMGVAAGGLGREPPLPVMLRILCGLGLFAAAVVAIALAARART